MTDDLVTEARKGGPCAELGDRCRAIEAASGCFCAAVADRIEALTAQLESTLRDRKLILEERDRTYALMLARVLKAEAERDQWIQHAKNAVWADSEELKSLTAERDRLWEALMDAREAWDNHMEYGEPMQGWWVADARAALTGKDDT
jgi:hypothetical protein